MNNKIESIQVFGTNCPSCKKLFTSTKEAVGELGLSVVVEYIDDIEKMMALGVMSSPVLVIDNKVVLAGQLPSVEKIKELISANQEVAPEVKSGGCSCCGGC